MRELVVRGRGLRLGLAQGEPEAVAGALHVGQLARLGVQGRDIDRRADLDLGQPRELALGLRQVATDLGALRERALRASRRVPAIRSAPSISRISCARCSFAGSARNASGSRNRAPTSLSSTACGDLTAPILIADLEQALPFGGDHALDGQISAVELDTDLGLIGAVADRVVRLRLLAAERCGERVEDRRSCPARSCRR
jgi:hypothetical protein